MKLEPWEPDLRSLMDRIDQEELDLQPDFQRGLVWPVQKQQRLIDTILRGWSMPPIHLLVLDDHRLAVLDGQQRLQAMHLFVLGRLRVGDFEPFDKDLASLRGCTFDDLDTVTKRQVLNYKVICYRLYQYTPEEPYELFFRLNLPSGLTQAEKRNALFGSARDQVKEIATIAEVDLHWGHELLGFANSRMAYEDVLSRACLLIEKGDLRYPLTAANLENAYRNSQGFTPESLSILDRAVRRLTESRWAIKGAVRFNKATLLSWLLVSARLEMLGLDEIDISDAIYVIEGERSGEPRILATLSREADIEAAFAYLQIYSDRASLRVTDVLSIITRDAMIWRIMRIMGTIGDEPRFHELFRRMSEVESRFPADFDARVLDLVDRNSDWGKLP